MRATFIGGPCGGHSHAIDDGDVPDTRPHGCQSSSKKDEVKGHYERIGNPPTIASDHAPTARDVIFYKWVADDNAGS